MDELMCFLDEEFLEEIREVNRQNKVLIFPGQILEKILNDDATQLRTIYRLK